MAIEIEGMDRVMKSLNKEIKGIVGKTRGGLLAAGFIIEKEAAKRAPKDTANLVASRYTMGAGRPFKYTDHSKLDRSQKHIMPASMPEWQNSVQIGFTAAYALFVHENREQKLKGQPRTSGSGKGTYWETGEPGFLTNALREKQNEVVRQIIVRAKV